METDSNRAYIAPPNYTQMPNAILDSMATMTGAEYKVFSAVARLTFGWHQNAARISISRLEKMTGLARHSVIDCLKAGVDRGILLQLERGDARTNQGSIWALNVLEDDPSAKIAPGLVQKSRQPSAENVQTASENSLENGTPSYSLKKLIKENNKDKKNGASAPKSQPAGEELLLGNTPGGKVLEALLRKEFRAKGRRFSGRFPSTICRDAWVQDCESKLTPEQLQAGVEKAIKRGILSVASIQAYLAKIAKGDATSNGNGKEPFLPPADLDFETASQWKNLTYEIEELESFIQNNPMLADEGDCLRLIQIKKERDELEKSR